MLAGGSDAACARKYSAKSEISRSCSVRLRDSMFRRMFSYAGDINQFHLLNHTKSGTGVWRSSNCALSPVRRPIRLEDFTMATYEEGRFVRFPTELLEALIGARLSGTQFRILLWVVRGTYGWNRRSIPFTWYRIAKELFLDRPVTYRAGKTLLQTGVLLQEDHQLSIQNDSRMWDAIVLSPRNDNARQLWMPEITVAWEQRQALSGNNVTVAGRQRNRCQETTLFRRVKD